MNQYENTTRYLAPSHEPDAYEEGYTAYYDMRPTPANYLELVVPCPDYAPGSVHHDVFYTGVRAAMKHYESNL